MYIYCIHKLTYYVTDGHNSIGHFVKKTLPQFFIDLYDEGRAGAEIKLNLSENHQVNRNLMEPARILVDVSECSQKYINYVKFKSTVINFRGVKATIPFKGYVFNSSTHVWSYDTRNSLTLETAKKFLMTIVGITPPDCLSWKDLSQLCINHHHVKVSDEGKYICDCAGYWHSTICSHVLAAKHLDGIINLNDMLFSPSLYKTKLIGRPKNVPKVGYASQHKNYEIKNPTRDYGMHVARRIDSSNLDDVYFGVVVGKTNVQLNNCFVMLNNINYELCDLYRTSKPIT